MWDEWHHHRDRDDEDCGCHEEECGDEDFRFEEQRDNAIIF